MSSKPVVQPTSTPNPRSVKFLTDRTLLASGSADFRDPQVALASPLARKLFDFDHVEGVFVCQNFVTITVTSDDVWTQLIPRLSEAIGEFLESGEVAVEAPVQEETAGGSEIETRIREILDQQIRPAVAMDGGDVVFVSFDDGLVRLSMQGACGGCPSSTATLKQGIEARLRHLIPEVQRVEAV